jgi:putative ABC transport system permease protein
MNPFPLMFSGLRKSLLSVFAVVFLLSLALAAGIAVNMIDRSLRVGGAVSADKFDLVVGAPGSGTQLVLNTVYLQNFEILTLIDHSIYDTLAADPRVAAAAPIAFADSWQGSSIVGSDLKLFEILGIREPAQGRLFSKSFEAVVGSAVPLETGATFLSIHGESEAAETQEEAEDAGHEHHDRPYTVVGKLAPTGTPYDKAIIVSIESIWEVHEEPGHHADDRISAVLVKPKTISDAYVLRGAWRPDKTTAVFPGEILVSLFGALDSVHSALSVLIGVVQVLVFVTLVLALLVGISRKRRQIAILRALGAGRLYIFLLTWGFIAAIVVGSLLGAAGAALFSSWFESVSAVRLNVSFESGEILFALTMSLVALIGATIPALAAYRQSPVKGLRFS